MNQQPASRIPPHAAPMVDWDRFLVLLPGMLLGLELVASVGGIIFMVAVPANRFEFTQLFIVTILVMVANGIMARLIISRYPRHVVGWLLLAISALFLLQLLAEAVRLAEDSDLVDLWPPLFTFFSWIALWIWTLQFSLPVTFLPLYFPTGRLLTPRWRMVAAAAAISVASFALANALHPGPYEDIGSTSLNPLTIPGGKTVAEFLGMITGALFLPTVLLVFISMLLRFHRAGPAERTQMKWLIYPLILAMIWWFGVISPLSLFAPSYEERLASIVDGWDFYFMVIGIPLAIGIAILRYRLFDIDLIIRRTLQYALLTSILGLVYFMLVIAFQGMFASAGTAQSEIGLVISTLAIAGLFNPLRIRIQRAIDRRFYRQKYQAEQALQSFAAAARDEVNTERLAAALLSVVQETIQPEHVSLWLPGQELEQGP